MPSDAGDIGLILFSGRGDFLAADPNASVETVAGKMELGDAKSCYERAIEESKRQGTRTIEERARAGLDRLESSSRRGL